MSPLSVITRLPAMMMRHDEELESLQRVHRRNDLARMIEKVAPSSAISFEQGLKLAALR